ncbi:angiotensinogen (serpin peptidase inhibitor, clade A, member 8) isoform X1 [Callorhinchus milii]|uniref:Angiotensinogen n=1 Tax=Callorhinchus milii TaxID=7868 RepID=A0A4W3HKG2_CALMI|nr:angiotensinogen (serpin peptidase inhibitor, clade A, member 8) isoform X1 [Callorhinchus milii]XP_042188614.1 angiotensinogen (serpin peptidase inhibitor, clade A, member 8) isoform X1 [Callorhinchus milii]|eukprot:gi/632977545/ref/XP_007905405.1/ PREDICTED: corticosteroid-binding globulin-like [Callorhinchus milii]
MKWALCFLCLGMHVALIRSNRPHIHPFLLMYVNKTQSDDQVNNKTFLPPLAEFLKLQARMVPDSGSSDDEDQAHPKTKQIWLKERNTKLQAVAISQTENTVVLLNHAFPPNRCADLVLSPLQIYSSLAALSLGAANATAQIFHDILGFTSSSQVTTANLREKDASVRQLNDFLLSWLPGRYLSTRNWIFVQRDIKVLESFAVNAKEFYNVNLLAIDFTHTPLAEQLINRYMHNASGGGRVKDPVIGLSPTATMMSASYMEFKGKWKKAFESHTTELQDFFIEEDRRIRVPTMSQAGWFQGIVAHEYTAIKLPMAGSTSMTIVQPVKVDLMQKIHRKLPIRTIFEQLQSRFVKVSLPKFKLDTTYNIKDIFLRMKGPDAFSSEADFSRLSNDGRLKPDKVINNINFELTEDWEEPVAQGNVQFNNATEIKINRPFLFHVYDDVSNTLLFVGRVKNLTEYDQN